MNAVVQTVEDPQLPAPVARRGITEAQWRTMVNSLFPGAQPKSVVMVWDYCVARKLDPLKKPCHIVPMQVKDAISGDYVWRDVVMPGIYEHRTTATRTGFYLGHSVPEYGEPADHLGVIAPEWCSMTVYRWNPEAKFKAEYPVRVYFRESAATRKDRKSGDIMINDRWSKAPIQMLTKCTEAAGLREAFPDELGGQMTAEEAVGHEIDEEPSLRNNPRGDLSNVDWELRDKHVSAIADILNADKEEAERADMLRAYFAEFLDTFHELSIAVSDELAIRRIASKSALRGWLNLGLEHRR